ncbi:MAG: DUF1003 domain-containing protein [Candidatus Magasanikbacteria bacterium]|nr:DUF1003 domain-containing protein [Candidatus Magasanikbacteria bacterium]
MKNINQKNSSSPRHHRSKHVIRALRAHVDAKRTPGEVAADFLTSRLGTMAFLGINFLFFLIWILINARVLPVVPSFDPYPFHFLTFSVSLEAIFLAIVVLISQKRAAKMEDLREEVDLQIDIIAEHELTSLIKLLVATMKAQNIPIPDEAKINYLLRPLDTEKVERALTEEVQK